ncbi:MAG TPA: tetratricopeptide repeat protein [Polyangiaceae bacterium]|nr:tetratricopeptide repeat protein [Polyangiaceae bacterium]
MLAGILIESRKLDEALACLGSAVALDPQHSGAADILSWLSPAEIPGAHLDLRTNRFYVAQELLDAGPERAATYMSAALIRATPSAAVDVLASLENEKGSEFTAEVRRVLFPVLRAQLDVQHSHLEEAEALFQARRFDEATVEYTAATRDNPSDGAAWMGIGDCYYHLGKFNLATAFFEESVLLRPDAPTYLFLGDAHLKGGRFSGAREAYQAALNVNPNYDFAHRRLVELDRQMTNAQ